MPFVRDKHPRPYTVRAPYHRLSGCAGILTTSWSPGTVAQAAKLPEEKEVCQLLEAVQTACILAEAGQVMVAAGAIGVESAFPGGKDLQCEF